MKIGFLGFGNIAQAMVQGLLLNDTTIANDLYASSLHYDKLESNTNKYGIHACQSNQELVNICDFVFVCVKPHQVKEVLKSVKLNGKIIICLAAGIYNKELEEMNIQAHHITCIPNTAVSVCEGVLVIEEEHTLTTHERKMVSELLSKVGMVETVETKKMNIATTISGCTPAYTAMFLEALGDVACKYGLSREVGYRLASKMLEGTGKMARQANVHPGVLKDRVCSPYGTTIKGVASLEKDGFRGCIIHAIDEVMKG